ncbi:hypothetical protein AK812_SmicGene35156 [Symbiodinium microadriaticum]|uniref:Uncharacterized protein n=1 Tax=Symbiodinium microadriaticum TaxID=2951 RepID=A0A1Q9CM69_SYMMI|nr:hypothetical protein AK812_SmicGene35156 [Symbiodinium microadriaticum]
MVDSPSTLSSRNFFWSCESKTVSATLRVRMSPVKRPCDSVRSPNSFMPPLAPSTVFATIKHWTQTNNYAIKNSEQDNQAAQRMQELEEEAAKYKQRLCSAGLQVTPTKALPIQDPASVASSRPVSKTRSKHHLFLHQTPQVINQPRRRLQRGDRKKQYGHMLEEPFNVIKQSGQDPPTSMTSLKTWVTNIKKNLPSPKQKELDQHMQQVQQILEKGIVPELYTFSRFTQPCAVYVKLKFPKLNSAAKHEYNRVAKLRQFKNLKLPKTEISIRYWHDPQNYEHFSTLVLSQHREYIDASAEGHCLIQRWQPKLNYPFVTKELVKKTHDLVPIRQQPHLQRPADTLAKQLFKKLRRRIQGTLQYPSSTCPGRKPTYSVKSNMVQIQAQRIPDIIKFSFDASAFTAIGEVFQQTCGTAMGNQISPILSTCTIVATEITWLRMFDQYVSSVHMADQLWICRYVDNRAIIVDSEELQRNPYIWQLTSWHFYKRYRIEFSLFTKHATGSWKGNRIVLSAYTTLRANEITTKDRNYLKKIGKSIDRDDDYTPTDVHCFLFNKRMHVYYALSPAAAITMAVLEPTTYSPSSSISTTSDEEPNYRIAEDMLTNKTLFKLILKFHHEIRVRLVVIHNEDNLETMQASQHVGDAMDLLAEQHGQAYHTTVIRDYRPHHALFEKLLTPQVVNNLLLANMQIRCTTTAATMDMRLRTCTRALHSFTRACARLKMAVLDSDATTLIFKTYKKMTYKEFLVALSYHWPAAVQLGTVIDFIHLPWKKLVARQAVVNFTSPTACQSCFQILAEAKGRSNMLISDFKQAEHQGLSENLALFLTKAMMLNSFDSQSKPHVFSNGTEIPLSMACAKFLPPEMVLAAITSAAEETKPCVLDNTSIEFPPGLKHSSVQSQFRAKEPGIGIGEDLRDCVHVGEEGVIVFRL